MSLCSEAEQQPTPRSPRGEWTAKRVLDSLSDALCTFLDQHYFRGSAGQDEEISLHAKQVDDYMGGADDDIPLKKKGIEYEVYEDSDAALYESSADMAQDRLFAYEHIIREAAIADSQDGLPIIRAQPEGSVSRRHWQQVFSSPRSVAAPTAPPAVTMAAAPALPAPKTGKGKAKKSAAKAAKAVKDALVPRAAALDATAPPAKAKKAKGKAAKKSARAVAVRV